MAGWLGKATSLFQPPPPPVDPFEVECDCGGRVVGLRTSTYQKRPCPRCERPVFVLPRNPYPSAKPKTAPKRKPGDPDAAGTADLASKRTSVDLGPPPAASKSDKLPTAGAARPAKPVAIEAADLVLEPRRRVFTPIRLLTLAIVTMTVATGAALWHRYQVETAKTIVAKAADAAEAALRDGDFVVAAREFERARNAVDVIGRTDRAANEIRRMSRQTTAASKLATSTLTEVLEESLARKKSGQSSSVQLTSTDQGSWVIFDTRIVEDDNQPNVYQIDAPMQFEATTILIVLETEIFRQLPQTEADERSPRVIFAAQLEEIVDPAGDPPVGKLKLNGKTAFLWSSYDMYASIGYRPFDAESEHQTRTLLERQHDVPLQAAASK